MKKQKRKLKLKQSQLKASALINNNSKPKINSKNPNNINNKDANDCDNNDDHSNNVNNDDDVCNFFLSAILGISRAASERASAEPLRSLSLSLCLSDAQG